MKKCIFILLIIIVTICIPLNLLAQDFFRQEGIASWYGREFDGRLTASGEVFNSSELTAAHPSLPFGTMLVVTNLHNNKSVTVRINDRGPFVPARIIDVSRAAAELLDIIVTGTAPVSVVSTDRIAINNITVNDNDIESQNITEAVTQTNLPEMPVISAVSSVISAAVTPIQTFTSSPAPVSQSAAVQLPVHQLRLTPQLNIVTGRNYRLQIGSYTNARNAVDAFDRLKNAGLNPAYERYVNDDNIEYFRVVVAGIPGADVQSTTEKIIAAGFWEALIREEN